MGDDSTWEAARGPDLRRGAMTCGPLTPSFSGIRLVLFYHAVLLGVLEDTPSPQRPKPLNLRGTFCIRRKRRGTEFDYKFGKCLVERSAICEWRGSARPMYGRRSPDRNLTSLASHPGKLLAIVVLGRRSQCVTVALQTSASLSTAHDGTSPLGAARVYKRARMAGYPQQPALLRTYISSTCTSYTRYVDYVADFPRRRRPL